MDYKKYQHIEKIGREECVGVLNGEVYIQPKIDGTNSCVFLRQFEDNNGDTSYEICAGSRNRELDLANDNAGFYAYILKQQNILDYLLDHPNHILYGEWLVPHTIKYYADDAWRKFYVFDVFELNGDTGKYLPYNVYKKELEKYNIEYIPILDALINPTPSQLESLLKNNHYLLADKEHIGEGIVCKNYSYTNKWGHQIWGKIVAEEFFGVKKELRTKNHELKENFEMKIANDYITDAVVKKEYAKIKNERPDAQRNELIGRLLNGVYDTFLTEDLATVVRKNKTCTINFQLLRKSSDTRCKEVLKDELF